MGKGRNDWDLVVAGAGPAGCALAARVASRGWNVLLLERSAEPGEGRGWIVDVERGAFDEAGVPQPSEADTWTEPDSQIMVSSSSGAAIEMIQPAPVLPVRNSDYVCRLAEWAVESGVELKTGCIVKGPVVEEGKVCGVAYDSGPGDEIIARAPLAADCTGISGALRKGTPHQWFLSGELDPRDLVLARREVREVRPDEARQAVDRGEVKDRVRVDRTGVISSYSVKTYYMDIDRGFIDILVGGKLGGRFPTADEWFARILDEWDFVGRKIFGDGGPIPVRRSWESLVGEGLLVLGDSACQVIPMHGSGTASALISAGIAADTVDRALEQGRFDRAALWDYCHAYQSGRGALLAYFFAIQRFTDNLTGEDIDRLVARRVISPEDFYNGLFPRKLQMKPTALAEKLARGLPVLPMLLKFAVAGLKGERLMSHYRSYPELFSQKDLEKWAGSVPRVD